MVKGWRNDPRWVELYRKRDEDRIARQVAFKKREAEAAVNAVIASMDRLLNTRPYATYSRS